MFTKLCWGNVVALACTTEAHCFYCFHSFNPATLTEADWTDKGTTAICPNCGVDSLLAGALTKTELQGLKAGHFGG